MKRWFAELQLWPGNAGSVFERTSDVGHARVRVKIGDPAWLNRHGPGAFSVMTGVKTALGPPGRKETSSVHDWRWGVSSTLQNMGLRNQSSMADSRQPVQRLATRICRGKVRAWILR